MMIIWTQALLQTPWRKDRGPPVPMDMGGTERKAVVEESGVNNGPAFCSLQEVPQVTQVSVTTSHSIPGAVLIQDKHLSRTEPSLHKRQQSC